MNNVKPTYNSFRLYLKQPLYLYFHDYFRIIKEEGFRGHFSINFILWCILTVANLIDILVTYYVFTKGGVEANPAMALICTKYGSISLAFYKGILLGILLLLLPFIRALYQKILMVTCFIYVILVFSHVIRF